MCACACPRALTEPFRNPVNNNTHTHTGLEAVSLPGQVFTAPLPDEPPADHRCGHRQGREQHSCFCSLWDEKSTRWEIYVDPRLEGSFTHTSGKNTNAVSDSFISLHVGCVDISLLLIETDFSFCMCRSRRVKDKRTH